MNIWIDAQLPPTLASLLNNSFEVNAMALRDFGLIDAKDIEIFEAAQVANKEIVGSAITYHRAKFTPIRFRKKIHGNSPPDRPNSASRSPCFE
ncbi:MAG: DUF5615 family PIN-like protein [Symplocastrum torsivum CPER-KK1]|jgi:hypothetical protein|uniref:DUF5615 family PIN-like protein n=1 Tax=Symplocastrum torsivum CPER-KK1 TaxID=450513 RepID=A0A951PQV5_9CYAN|nr:DUF5615 family PIN-like protein [Symplocastrum torsivum CPER-KK1]